jgi:hypothetical protein
MQIEPKGGFLVNIMKGGANEQRDVLLGSFSLEVKTKLLEKQN